MSLGLQDQLLSEFDREMGATRRVLARVPDACLGWQPHGRSMSMGRLTTHIAQLAGWIAHIVDEPSFDLALAPAVPRVEGTSAAIASLFERESSRARTAICGTTDARLVESWTLRKEGHVLLTAPRIVAVRTEGLYHLTHHRGQLTVYLRLLDLPVPPIYGPTADEGRF